MVYVALEHSEDDDSDFYSFNSLMDVVNYLRTEFLTDDVKYVISSEPFQSVEMGMYEHLIHKEHLGWVVSNS